MGKGCKECIAREEKDKNLDIILFKIFEVFSFFLTLCALLIASTELAIFMVLFTIYINICGKDYR